MRKFILIFALICVGITSPVLAGTVGNPISTDEPQGEGIFSLKQDKNSSIRGGLDFEFLLNRNLAANASTNLELTSGRSYMARISYSLFDRIEPYFKLGIAQYDVKWTESGRDIEIESDEQYAWALGLKTLILNLESPKMKLIADGFYRMAALEPSEGRVDGSLVSVDSAKSVFTITEWQIALALATEIDIGGGPRGEFLGVSKMMPYIGAKYSDIGGRIRATISDAVYYNPGIIESDNNYGCFVGCDFIGPNSVVLNVEGRFVDENAITVGLAAQF
ncbi:MAG: hypothetical protein ABH825_02280 [Candidatus Omnitrophota bacterium]